MGQAVWDKITGVFSVFYFFHTISMATLRSIAAIPARNSLNSTTKSPKIPPNFFNQTLHLGPNRSFLRLPGPPLTKAASTPSTTTSTTTRAAADEEEDDEAMSIDALKQFMDLNLGKWTGSFHQFDPEGNLLHKIDTRLSTSTYGEDELISLIQTLYIKQPSSKTLVSGDQPKEEWAEYKIKETNMFTVEKYQQICFFPQEKAFALRYQTAGMLENVLRQGVLGEDDVEEESPKNLKLPSKRPSIVCENCLYSLEKDMRVRAFHIIDPKGVIELLLIFLEERGSGVSTHPFLDENKDNTDRITPHLGKWVGQSMTKRSGVYGATIAEAKTITTVEFDENGQVIQEQNNIPKICDGKKNVPTNVRWMGEMSGNVVTYDKDGFQAIFLPGGMYMGCPCNVGHVIGQSNSFHLELCWLESPGKRRRLIRTYDVEGMVVSSTYIFETKL